MVKKYWAREAPRIIETEKNIIEWFKEAGKLQIRLHNWIDSHGFEKRGKLVSLDLVSLLDPERMMTRESYKHVKELAQYLFDEVQKIEEVRKREHEAEIEF